MNNAKLKEVVSEFAELFKTRDRASYILNFADKDLTLYDLSGSPKMMWFRIMQEAKSSAGGIMSILKIALEEYPDNVLLKSLVSTESDTVIEKSYIPFNNFLKNLNQDALGEISRVNCNRNSALKAYHSASFSKCNISFVVGASTDNPHNFVERIILENQGPTSNQSGKQSSIWSYRNTSGDNRIDEIPFILSANFDISLNNFKSSIEKSFSGINIDQIDQYFQTHQYKDVYISINYDYDLGNEILQDFTNEIYSIFNKKTETAFHIFFIMGSVIESQKVITHINQIKNSLNIENLIAVEAVSPALDKDIHSWKSRVGLDTYTIINFIEDLTQFKIPIEEINNYKDTKQIKMQYMEIFQQQLYDFYHNQK